MVLKEQQPGLMKMIKVSVITATYNSEGTIHRNIKSVQNQKDIILEQIFVDGGSSDNTVGIIESLSSNRSSLIIGQDSGIYDALNIGIEKSSGEFIAILNSDDFFSNDRVLSDIITVFEREHVDIVYSGITYVNSKYEVIAEWVPEEFSLGAFSDSWHPPHPGFFVRKDCYEKAGGFDLNFKVAADFELMYRFLETNQFKSALFSRSTVNMRNDGYSSFFKSRVRGLLDVRNTFRKHGNKTPLVVIIIKRYIKKFKRVFIKNWFTKVKKK